MFRKVIKSYILPIGMAPKEIEKLREEIQCAHSASWVDFETKGRQVDVVLWYGELKKEYKYRTIGEGLTIPIGYSYSGLQSINLESDNHVYVLFAGPQGTGKSTALRGCLVNIVKNCAPEFVKVYPVDFKLGAELGWLEGNPLTDLCAFDPENGSIVTLLDALNAEVRLRMQLFRDNKVRKLSEYREKVELLPYLLLIIDEYSEIQKAGKEVEQKLLRLMMIGRAAGLRAIISTVRPSSDVLNSSIKSLLLDRVCFKVVDRVNSEVVLDMSGAEKLPSNTPGRGLYLSSAKLTEIQVMNCQ